MLLGEETATRYKIVLHPSEKGYSVSRLGLLVVRRS